MIKFEWKDNGEAGDVSASELKINDKVVARILFSFGYEAWTPQFLFHKDWPFGITDFKHLKSAKKAVEKHFTQLAEVLK